MPKPKIVDLFCGCGGFGLGAELAGFTTFAAVDIDSTLQSAYKLNFPKVKVIEGDLSTFRADTWEEILNGTLIDGVIGGPPCQGYSRIGKSDKSDSRRTLLSHFFRNVNLVNPKFFIMENVEGLMDSRNKYELENALTLLDSRYRVLPPMIVNASHYGAPTQRKRVIVIGYDPSRLSSLNIDAFKPLKSTNTTVSDAIIDLGTTITQSRESDDFGWGQYSRINQPSSYAKKMRSLPRKDLGWTEARVKLEKGQVSGFFETVHSSEVMERYKNTANGKTDPVSRAKKLDWNGLCPTLRAGTGSDKGSHQAVRPIHPEEPRVITVREAARLQGFPDWFVFHPTKWHSFRMIGNSVSPIVSEAILKVIKRQLR